MSCDKISYLGILVCHNNLYLKISTEANYNFNFINEDELNWEPGGKSNILSSYFGVNFFCNIYNTKYFKLYPLVSKSELTNCRATIGKGVGRFDLPQSDKS